MESTRSETPTHLPTEQEENWKDITLSSFIQRYVSPTSAWHPQLSTACVCSQVGKTIFPFHNRILSTLIYCPCLSTYLPVDPEGLIRCRILNHLLRVNYALGTGIDMDLQDLM